MAGLYGVQGPPVEEWPDRRDWSFQQPATWPKAPRGWFPPNGWQPDPLWPTAPPGWTVCTRRPAPRYASRGIIAWGGLSLFAGVLWIVLTPHNHERLIAGTPLGTCERALPYAARIPSLVADIDRGSIDPATAPDRLTAVWVGIDSTLLPGPQSTTAVDVRAVATAAAGASIALAEGERDIGGALLLAYGHMLATCTTAGVR
jgi:hypothetical protein